MIDKVKYWVELSDYDFDTALAMQKSGRYLYVGFMCHQTIEKIFKAYFNFSNNSVVPHSHSLSYIAKKGNIYEELSVDFQDFIDELEPLNIETRYPTHKERLIKSLTKEKCETLIEKTSNLQQWIKEKLSKN